MSLFTVAGASLIAVPLFGAVPGPVLSLRAPDLRMLDDEREMQAWHAEREKQWVPLARQAGSAREGVLLRAWLEPPSPVAGRPARLVLSLVNLGDKPVALENTGWLAPPPAVLARGPTRSLVRLARSGVIFYSSPRSGSNPITPALAPGHGLGRVLRLDELLQLDKPGTYSVIGAEELRGDISGLVVSKVLPLELRPSTSADAAEKVGRADKERLEPQAAGGRPCRGCVLEAAPTPVAVGPPRVVVTLTRVGDEPGTDYAHPLATSGADAIDYTVVVRDSSGKRVPLNQRGRAALAAPRRPYQHNSLGRRGDAVGAVIPLADWFDLAKPGEYSVLASLVLAPWPTPDAPTWVAKPITVKVGK
jgi:hypothetical protein